MSYVGQIGTRFIKSNGMDNKFEYNFLIICVDLNLNKKNSANRKFTSCYNI